MPPTNHRRRPGREPGRESGRSAVHEVVTVEKMAAGGDGIARVADGRVLFVTGGLPGERVGVRVHTTKKDFARGEVTEVLEPSPHRAAAPCPALAAGCGGCQWQHVDPAGQVELKRDVVVDALRRTARMPDAAVAVGGSVPPWGYRTTMRFAVGAGGRLGLRAVGSHDVVVLDGCPVAHPAIDAMLPEVRVEGADEVTIRVSGATGEVTALLLGGDTAGRHRVSGLPAGARVGPEQVLHEDVAGVRLQVSAASFFQSGPAAAELLVRTVRDACGELLHEDGPVLDAYGGAGLFAAALPMRTAIVVESSRSACADARVNLPYAVVECTSFEDWSPQPVRLVVADPARAGLSAAGAATLARTNAERIVLVSCDPVAMARDAALLAGHGYRHGGSTVLDLFPQTPHVEVVTVFDREG